MFRLSKTIAAVAFLVAAIFAFAAAPTNHVAAQKDNRAVVTAIFDAYNAAIKSGDTKALEAFLAPTYKDWDAPEGTSGVDYLKGLLAANNVAAPDAKYEIKTMVAEGDKVAVHNVFSGTHTGKLADLDATGKKFSVKSIDIFTFKDGKVIEHVSASDTAGFYQQLGFTLQPPTK